VNWCFTPAFRSELFDQVLPQLLPIAGKLTMLYLSPGTIVADDGNNLNAMPSQPQFLASSFMCYIMSYYSNALN
jgi:hypothetical protein